MRERFSRWICRHLHRGITRPVCGEYICLRCQMRFPVLWQMPIAAPKVGVRLDFQVQSEAPAPSSAATGLLGPFAGISPDGEVWAISTNGQVFRGPGSFAEVAELERLLSLDRPKRVE